MGIDRHRVKSRIEHIYCACVNTRFITCLLLLFNNRKYIDCIANIVITGFQETNMITVNLFLRILTIFFYYGIIKAVPGLFKIVYSENFKF